MLANLRCLLGEPPYFLRQHSSSDTSNLAAESITHLRSGGTLQYKHPLPRLPHSTSQGSSTGDFRSVIDDLTIENRKLKERLRKYEVSHSAHLEKDMLFEVKIHGLPAKKRRELEETLRSFAASVDGSSDFSAQLSHRKALHHVSVPSKKTSLSYSMSRPVDSAYASMSTSGPMSTSTPIFTSADHDAHNQQSSKKEKIHSFLHDIPKGLLPRHSAIMTERQKKKLVVRRLEQLFTGKEGGVIGVHSQPLQQQEVSKSAAMADRAASSNRSSAEGVREAHMLPYEMETDSRKPKLADDSSHNTNHSKALPDSIAEDTPSSSLEQRPTRPLDLDPDRAQIPSDNIEYIRHLGLSTPSFEHAICGDVEADSDGWIYLNLLINMAQLHIVNVTPDFVRSAVADVSDKFQLSRDGTKIRWKGGTGGTRFSSDSGTSSSKDASPMDSDSLDEPDRKRRKINIGRFASVPLDINDRNESSKATQQHPFYYKPLFHHRGSSSEEVTSSVDGESDSPPDYDIGDADDSGIGRASRGPRVRCQGSHSMLGGRPRRRNDGPIVFYSGAQFCTDLSGDRETISIPLHETTISASGYRKHTRDVLGCSVRSCAQDTSRTPSGSVILSRPFKEPFKDYSEVADPFLTIETRPTTLDVLVDEGSDLDARLKWASSHSPMPLSPMSFAASGLGGTQPADHFAVRVETRRTVLDYKTQRRLSKFSAPGHGSKEKMQKNPKSYFEMFQEPARPDPEEIMPGLASLHTSSLPSGQQAGDLPVQTEIVSAQFFRLQPSVLPPPTGYYAKPSSSDSDSGASSNSSSCSGTSHLRGQKPFVPRSHVMALTSETNALFAQESTEIDQDSGEMQDDEDDDIDDDSDESIDMLASAQDADLKLVIARGEEFERHAV